MLFSYTVSIYYCDITFYFLINAKDDAHMFLFNGSSSVDMGWTYYMFKMEACVHMCAGLDSVWVSDICKLLGHIS